MPDRFQELVPYVPPKDSVRSTQSSALRHTARFMKGRYQEILELLEVRPLCIFEVAQALSRLHQTTIHDHQVSGRFGTLFDAGLIEKGPATRPTPTGCPATIYNLSLSGQALLQEARTPQPTPENTEAQSPGGFRHDGQHIRST